MPIEHTCQRPVITTGALSWKSLHHSITWQLITREYSKTTIIDIPDLIEHGSFNHLLLLTLIFDNGLWTFHCKRILSADLQGQLRTVTVSVKGESETWHPMDDFSSKSTDGRWQFTTKKKKERRRRHTSHTENIYQFVCFHLKKGLGVGRGVCVCGRDSFLNPLYSKHKTIKSIKIISVIELSAKA